MNPACPHHRARTAPRRRVDGFTLLEMIVVLVIIGLIMGLIGPRLFGQADKAKVQTAQTQVRMLKGALETMRLDIGRFPTDEEGLELLVTRPADAALNRRLKFTSTPSATFSFTPAVPSVVKYDASTNEILVVEG